MCAWPARNSSTCCWLAQHGIAAIYAFIAVQFKFCLVLWSCWANFGMNKNKAPYCGNREEMVVSVCGQNPHPNFPLVNPPASTQLIRNSQTFNTSAMNPPNFHYPSLTPPHFNPSIMNSPILTHPVLHQPIFNPPRVHPRSSESSSYSWTTYAAPINEPSQPKSSTRPWIHICDGIYGWENSHSHGSVHPIPNIVHLQCCFICIA